MDDEIVKAFARDLYEIDIPEPAMAASGSVSLAASERRLFAEIMARFAKWISANADSLPSKEDVLKMLGNAIDLAFSALNRPVIARLLGPLVKQAILEAAGKLYDSIVNPTPTIEV